MSLIDKSAILLTDEQRYELFMKALMDNREAWILTDEYGAVMLNGEEGAEDYVPFWPSQEMAELWADDEWAHCQAKKLSFTDLQVKWLPGMEEDDLSLIIFPGENLEGRIFYPWEFNDVLDKKLAKLDRKK